MTWQLPNLLLMEEDTLLRNLQTVQKRQGVAVDTTLAHLEGEGGRRFPNFSVEMETGTGKTYVYLRTIMELNQRYGLKKFIIVVPFVAVRETFSNPCRSPKSTSNSCTITPFTGTTPTILSNPNQVRNFALSNSIEILVMTIQSFTSKEKNIVYQSHDRLQGETPIDLLKATRPVLILDEPQNLESEQRLAALAELHPLFALRYSATHRKQYNLVYRLSPFEAYRQGLVKQIEVAGMEERDSFRVYLKLESITAKKTLLTAQLRVYKRSASGTIAETVITVRPDDDLEEKTGISDYQGYIVGEIHYGEDLVRFSNGVEIKKGQEVGKDKAAIFEAQIAYTIEEHFQKQRRRQAEGIKVLSLFFIDQVANYATEEGSDEAPLIRAIFDRCFNRLKGKYPEWKDIDPKDVQAGYFAAKKTKDGKTVFEDSTTGEAQKDKEVYDLIMKDKESLLFFVEAEDDEAARRRKQVSFIFTHSALREGWDNPNVFQICTLNQTVSTMRKRQEIGRGLRLAVNQDGERVRNAGINVLTVVANESYENYVSNLQTEFDEASGVTRPPLPPNARNKVTVGLRKEFLLKPEFKQLWERIKHKTRYAVVIDTDTLITRTLKILNQTPIPAPKVAVVKVRVSLEDNADVFSAMQMSGAKTIMDLSGRYPLPNVIDIMAELMERTTPPVHVSRPTLLKIFSTTTKKEAAAHNPHVFATIAVRILKEQLADLLVEGIQYEKIGKEYEMTLFETEIIETWEQYLVPVDHSIYEQVVWESETERIFAKALDKLEQVKLFVKLPDWFKVETPVGTYNPDWAIVWEPRDEHGIPTGEPLLYLVRETKSTTILDKLRADERRKIECGDKHFNKALKALDMNYKVVTNAKELP